MSTSQGKTDNDLIREFDELLENIKLTDKKKALWKQIYGHAIQDRSMALQMYVNCSNVVIADPTQHAIHGPNIAKYLERMSRSNDQLLKLAELVAAAEEVNNEGLTMSPDEIYEKLSGNDPAIVPFDKKKNKGR